MKHYVKIGGEDEDRLLEEYDNAIQWGNFRGSFEDFVDQENSNMRDEG